MTQEIPQDEQNTRDAEIHLAVQRFVEMCKGNDSRTMVRDSLPFIDPTTVTYDQGLSIGKAIHRVFGGADSGFLVWCAWATKVRDKWGGEIQLAARWKAFGEPKEDVYQEQREAGDRTTEYLKNLEVGGFKLSDVIDFGIAHLYATNPASKIPTDMAGRFYGSIAIEMGRTVGYWYRRTEIAETALEPFGEMHPKLEAGMLCVVGGDDQLAVDCRHAHAVLAERRKWPEKNLEDEARDRRQEKFFNFAVRTWGPVAGEIEQRAVRGLEEQLELTDAMHVHYVVSNNIYGEAGDTTPSGRANYLKRLCADLIDHVVRKPADSPEREIGGVALTLLASAQVLGLSVATCEKAEFVRVLAKPRKELQDKHAAKKR